MNKIATIMTRHWKPLLLLNLAVAAAIAGKFSFSEKTWNAKAQLIIPETNDNLEANLGRLGSLKNSSVKFSDTVNPLLAQQSVLTSDIVFQQVLAADPQKDKFSRLTRYKKLFDVSIEEQSTTLELNVKGRDRQLAHQRAAAWIEAYNNRLNQLRKEDAQKRSQYTDRELVEAQEKLNQAQAALSNFQRTSGLVNSDEQTKESVKIISDLTSAKAQAEAKAEAETNRAKALSARLNLEPDQAMQSVGLGENQDYQAIRGKLRQIEIELNTLRATRTEQDPMVEELSIERQELQNQLQQFTNNPSSSARVDGTVASNAPQGRANLIQQLVIAESSASAQKREAEQLGTKIEELQKNLRLIPTNQARLLELKRQQEIAEGVYQGLVAQLQQAKINAFSAYPNVQVLEPPTVDIRPTNPKLSLAVLNLALCSLIGSTALLLWLEKRNPLLDAKDLQLFNFPLILSIRRLKKVDLLSPLDLDRGSEVELDFQRLASAVSMQPIQNRRLLITSSISGEGKTTITMGLAKALTDLGFRVLLVDGDFRKADLSMSLALDRQQTGNEQIIKLLPNLDLLPTIPQQGNITAKISQGKFEKTISAADVDGKYDYILVDSAPVSLTSETPLMATIIPNVLFVVRPDYSERNSSHDSIEQLKQLNVRILGLVVNGVEVQSRLYSYASYGSKSIEASKEQR